MLAEQIELAKRRIRQMKRAVPYLLPEWLELKNAERRLAEAKKDLAAKRAAWKKLGK